MKNVFQKITNILCWSLFVIILILALSIRPYTIHSLLLLLSAVIICPSVIKKINQKVKTMKIPYRIYALISVAFLIIAMYLSPNTNVENAFVNEQQSNNEIVIHNQTNDLIEEKNQENKEVDNTNIIEDKYTKPVINTTLEVQFIDVGQADCILIRNNNKNMLIDAGNNADGEKLVKYLKGLGITKFDVLVGTHPHEDHIGGLDNVISNFDIGKIYMPNVLTTTATFEDVLDAIEDKNLKIVAPKINDTFSMGDCNFKVLSVGNNSNDLNSCSIVLKLEFGDNDYIFMGDAESENENQMLYKDIQADVLKVRTSWL